MKNNTKSIFSVGMLIGGATIGAGILGLPIQTGLAGVVPSVFATLGIWILLTLTAFIITDRFAVESDVVEDFPTVFKKDFGVIGKFLVIVGYLINYYGIMVAYLCASTSILSFLIPFHLYDWGYLMIFFIPAAGITLFGLKYVLKANSLFMVVLILSFIILCFLITSRIDSSRFSFMDWKFFPLTLPIVVNAFLFHNIIPVVCHTMNNNKRKIKISIMVGTIIACAINIVWIVAVLGALPLSDKGGSSPATILYAFHHNQPATVPLAIALKSKIITIIGVVFSFCAIITSFVSVVVGLQGFLRDVFVSTFHIDNKILNTAAVFLPPLIIALAFPNFFLKRILLIKI
jgi:tyrosine-specific transport protein